MPTPPTAAKDGVQFSTWLSNALATQRQTIAQELERQHESIVAALRQQFSLMEQVVISTSIEGSKSADQAPISTQLLSVPPAQPESPTRSRSVQLPGKKVGGRPRPPILKNSSRSLLVEGETQPASSDGSDPSRDDSPKTPDAEQKTAARPCLHPLLPEDLTSRQLEDQTASLILISQASDGKPKADIDVNHCSTNRSFQRGTTPTGRSARISLSSPVTSAPALSWRPQHLLSDTISRATSSHSRAVALDLSEQECKCFCAWEQLRPSALATNLWFEAFFLCLIICNTVVVALELQYHGIDVGYKLGYPKFVRSAAEAWPNAQGYFDKLSLILGISFTVEVVIKLLGLGKTFAKDFWNWFDTLIVVLWIGMQVGGIGEEVDPLLLRVARLGRLLRPLRLARSIQGFDPLFLITTAMQGCCIVLFWSAALLFVVQLLMALLLGNFLDSQFLDPNKDESERLQLFEYFGTPTRALLTMFEIALGNWPPVARLLQETVSEWFIIFSILHKLTIGFAVIGVINAVFMQETLTVAASDDKLMMHQKERAEKLHIKKMEALFSLADHHGTGRLSVIDFKQVLHDPSVKHWLAAQELDVSDAELLFKLIDDGDRLLTPQELVCGAAKLKGPARSMDLIKLSREHRRLAEVVTQLYTHIVGPAPAMQSEADEACEVSSDLGTEPDQPNFAPINTQSTIPTCEAFRSTTIGACATLPTIT